jgi:hypothetical protein
MVTMSLSNEYFDTHDPLKKISQFKWKFWNRLYLDHFKEKESLVQYLDYVQNKFNTDKKYKAILKKAEISSLFLAWKDDTLQMFMTKKFYEHDKTNFPEIIKKVDFFKEEEYPELSPTKTKVNINISQQNFKKLFENALDNKTSETEKNSEIEEKLKTDSEKSVESSETETKSSLIVDGKIENNTIENVLTEEVAPSTEDDAPSTEEVALTVPVECVRTEVNNIDVQNQETQTDYCSNLHDIINLNGIEFVDLFSKFGDENIEKLLKKINAVRFLCKV